MKHTACDHCGEPAEYKSIPIIIGGYTEDADLCSKCLGELISMVERYIDGIDKDGFKE